jgi:CAI-1 autoinducer synthase
MEATYSQNTMSPAVRVPAWYREHMQPVCDFIATLNPFPFEQPSDISDFIALHQNDYLRLGNHPDVIAARDQANIRNRSESFMSSVYGGSSDECELFRKAVAECMQAEDVLLTTSGWAANVGLIEAISPVLSPVYIDSHAHASLYDGVKLSLGKKVVIEHNDTENLLTRIAHNGPGVVVIDAVYSTDGSIGDIARYLEICEIHDCVLVLDEAHSFGLFGDGGGLAVELGLAERTHFRTVSLNKALGGHGGLIAGNRDMMKLARARCRSIIFSSATSSVSAGGHRAALEVVVNDPGRAHRCLHNAEILRRRFHAHGIDTGDSRCQIVSIFFDDEQETCEFYDRLRRAGILTSVFLYPATPAGVGLVRYSVHSELTEHEIDETVRRTVEALHAMGRPVRMAA